MFIVHMRFIPFILVLIMSMTMTLSCSEAHQETEGEHQPLMSSASEEINPLPLPDELKAGESKFNTHCSRCHGRQAKGTHRGPPLVHKIYEPHHHADFAFQRAAAQGVRAHHWGFGNMPKIESVTPDDVNEIIGYIRWLQRQAGIY